MLTPYGRKRRRTLAWYQTHPRAFEEDVARHDSAELDRYLADQEAREPREDRFERDQARWLTRIDPDDFAA